MPDDIKHIEELVLIAHLELQAIKNRFNNNINNKRRKRCQFETKVDIDEMEHKIKKRCKVVKNSLETNGIHPDKIIKLENFVVKTQNICNQNDLHNLSKLSVSLGGNSIYNDYENLDFNNNKVYKLSRQDVLQYVMQIIKNKSPDFYTTFVKEFVNANIQYSKFEDNIEYNPSKIKDMLSKINITCKNNGVVLDDEISEILKKLE